MDKPHFHFFFPRNLTDSRGQGLVEYVILITIIGIFLIVGLTILGGSIEGGFIKVCAELGNDDCQAIQSETPVAGTVTPTLQVSMTPSLVPTATPTLSEPDPTRQPVLTVAPIEPVPTIELKKLRIKVISNGKGGGIQVVVYNTVGVYVTEGLTDDKGNISFLVSDGNYMVSTFYNNTWQKDGPFSTSNSKEKVIHR
ncbi:MAG: hypothetical protein Q7T89_02010 [Anaerolineales bacterium]|nr:hypothetical protein [Anaerolineales bacterium]